MADTIRIPTRFLDDHYERDLPTPTDIGKAKGYAVIRADDPDLAELLNDAEHYADPTWTMDPCYFGLKRSAVATVRAIRNAIGWDGASRDILTLRR